MQLKLRPGTPKDVPLFVEVTIAAFSTNPIHIRCLPPDSKNTHEFWLSSLAEEINDPNARFIVIEDLDTTPPSFVSCAKWNVVPENTHQPPLPDDIWPKDGDVDLANDFFGVLLSKHVEIMGTKQHWYLELIVTKPEYYGKGAGNLLVKWGTDEADKVGWPCYLDATPDGKRLYERNGFRNLETMTFLDGTYQQCFMLRDAKAVAN